MSLVWKSVVSLLLVSGRALPCDKRSVGANWEHVGPGGYADQDDPTKMVSAGAAQAAVQVGNSSWLIAHSNGGIWATSDVLAKPGPHWKQVLDGQPVSCTSMSAMESKGPIVLAGCGASTSSEMGTDWNVYNTGDWGGVMISRDAGVTWGMTNFPPNFFITAFVLHSEMSFVVAARSHFYNRSDGGVWATSDGGHTWKQTLGLPVYDLTLEPSSGIVLAALPWIGDSSSVLASASGGTSPDWKKFTNGVTWDGRTPFYPTFALGTSNIFVGALTVNPANLSDTASVVFYRAVSELTGPSGHGWQRVAGQPMRLDRDAMPKDRMALFVNPDDEDVLFVAGNADALTWRVNWRTGKWIESFGKKDTMDGSSPHGDCRRYFWEPQSKGLIMLSDGGAFIRESPNQQGGKWRSLAGDTGAMELVCADWDPVGRRWVGGAQDNDVQVAPINTTSTGRAIGVVGGDGSVTAVDAIADPPRLWGATQLLGNIADDDKPTEGDLSDEDDDDCTNFGFYQGNKFTCVRLLDWFTVDQFRYFVQPFALHTQDPTQVFVFVSSNKTTPGGIYKLDVPYTMKGSDDLASPKLEVHADGLQMLVVGGATKGKSDPSVLVAMNHSHLLHRSSVSGGELMTRRLPQTFAEPIGFPAYPTSSSYTLGPISHDRTVSMAVSPSDSSHVAVSGWTSLTRNDGSESIWASTDAGATFEDVTYNLRVATGTIGQVRPSALLLVPGSTQRSDDAPHATLLVGTVSGVFVLDPDEKQWVRFGDCTSFPLVLVAGLSYQKLSDTVVAATMGRGVYVIHGASHALAAALESQHRIVV